MCPITCSPTTSPSSPSNNQPERRRLRTIGKTQIRHIQILICKPRKCIQCSKCRSTSKCSKSICLLSKCCRCSKCSLPCTTTTSRFHSCKQVTTQDSSSRVQCPRCKLLSCPICSIHTRICCSSNSLSRSSSLLSSSHRGSTSPLFLSPLLRWPARTSPSRGCATHSARHWKKWMQTFAGSKSKSKAAGRHRPRWTSSSSWRTACAEI